MRPDFVTKRQHQGPGPLGVNSLMLVPGPLVLAIQTMAVVMWQPCVCDPVN